jgi:hypothetical protein
MLKPYDRFYKCLHVDIRQLVDPETFATLGDRCWGLFDDKLLSTIDRLQNRYNHQMVINTWHKKAPNPFRYRGFRSSDCTVGAKLSSHRRGQAIDFDVVGMTAEQVRKDIRDNIENLDIMFITQVENNVNWVHISTANVPNRIQWINP